jgi:diguanylate cyclase (GGDEF)-like protein
LTFTPPAILVADDDPMAREILSARLLKWGHTVVTAKDGREALTMLLDKDGPAIGLLDWSMPFMDGPDICAELRRLRPGGRPSKSYRYLILVTGRDTQSDVVAGLAAGADDYLTKPVDPKELKVRLSTAARILKLQNDLLATEHALRHQATHDLMTGAWNKVAALELLEREFARNRRDFRSSTVMLLDLDHFKAVNDSHGHPAGDVVLTETVARITRSLRREDIVARFGGEEFLLFLPGLGHLHARDLADRLLRAVRALPVDAFGTLIPVTTSIGAHVCEAGFVTTQSAIAFADKALYEAKATGRNRACFWPPLADETNPSIERPALTEEGVDHEAT